MKQPETYNLEYERKLIEASKKDHRYFGPVYERYYEQIFLFVMKRVGDEALCSDLTSGVFVKAMSKLNTYENRGYPFSAWLYRVAINEINMYYRKSKKHQTVEVSERDVIVIMEVMNEEEAQEDKIERLLSHLEKLKPAQQELIEMRFFDKCSFKKIGEILKITEGNAKIKTYRALDKLKRLMGE